MTPTAYVTSTAGRTPRRLLAALGVAATACTLLVSAGQSADAASTSTDKQVAKDTFSGSSRSLGQAELGGTWQVSGSGLKTGGNQLTVPTLGKGKSYSALLPSVSATDVTVKHGVKLGSVNSSKSGLFETTQLRRQSDGDRYHATLIVGASGKLELRLDRVVDGKQVTLGRQAVSAKVSNSSFVNVESRVTGTNPVVIQARAWTGSSVPDWQVTAKDSSSSAVKTKGSVGLSGYLSSSGVATSLALNSFSATDRVTTTTPASTPTPTPTVSAAARPTTPAAKPTPTATTPAASTKPTPTPTATTTQAPSTPGLPTLNKVTTNGFTHPGVLNSADSLAAVRANANAGKEPAKSALATLKKSKYASASWTPHPVATVGCGAGSSPDEGCSAEKDDAQAAYANAMMWYFTGDKKHADAAIRIMNAWSGTIKSHKFDTKVYVNGKLQSAWVAQTFTKAAEIVRYSEAGWSAADVTNFENMLKSAYLPAVIDGWNGGGANWLLSMADATTAIGVFTNDRSVFENGVGDWRKQIRGTIYLASDGSQPVLPSDTYVTGAKLNKYWNSPTKYVDGLQGETCRDAGHMAMGFAAALDTAETARIQGVDLYGEEQRRLITGMEFNAKFLNNPKAAGWPCANAMKMGGSAWELTWEIGYNHYAGRKGVQMPETKKLIGGQRPGGSMLFMNWESLTHGTAL